MSEARNEWHGNQQIAAKCYRCDCCEAAIFPGVRLARFHVVHREPEAPRPDAVLCLACASARREFLGYDTERNPKYLDRQIEERIDELVEEDDHPERPRLNLYEALLDGINARRKAARAARGDA